MVTDRKLDPTYMFGIIAPYLLTLTLGLPNINMP